MLLGIVLNFIGLDPIKMLIYSAVLNGMISPFMIFFFIRLSSNREVMCVFKNKKITNIFGWLTLVLISLVGIGAIIFIFL